MTDESEQLTRRNRLMRDEALRLTPEQRMARMAELQQAFFEMLQRSPEAYTRFWRRNLRQRAVHHDPQKPI
jgi:hypothetical protein